MAQGIFAMTSGMEHAVQHLLALHNSNSCAKQDSKHLCPLIHYPCTAAWLVKVARHDFISGLGLHDMHPEHFTPEGLHRSPMYM